MELFLWMQLKSLEHFFPPTKCQQRILPIVYWSLPVSVLVIKNIIFMLMSQLFLTSNKTFWSANQNSKTQYFSVIYPDFLAGRRIPNWQWITWQSCTWTTPILTTTRQPCITLWSTAQHSSLQTQMWELIYSTSSRVKSPMRIISKIHLLVSHSKKASNIFVEYCIVKHCISLIVICGFCVILFGNLLKVNALFFCIGFYLKTYNVLYDYFLTSYTRLIDWMLLRPNRLYWFAGFYFIFVNSQLT